MKNKTTDILIALLVVLTVCLLFTKLIMSIEITLCSQTECIVFYEGKSTKIPNIKERD